MKVLLAARLDLLSERGGDSTQVLETKAELEKLGVETELVTDLNMSLNGIDLVHVFNINRSAFALACIERAAKKNVPTALSPIYWSPMECILRGMHSSPAKRWYDAASRLLPLPRKFPTAIRDAVVYSVSPKVEKSIDGFERKMQNRSLRLADIVLPNSNAESAHLKSIFGVQTEKMHVVYNGIQPDRLRGSGRDPFLAGLEGKEFVLYTGRVEERKNTLTLIRACNELGLALVVIGRLAEGTFAAKYVTQCLTEARKGSVTFVKELPMESEQLYLAYRSAKVHALPSWYETPGLSSLEAAACGCNVVATMRGSAREYFADLAWYCDPASRKSVKDAIAAAYAHPRDLRLRELVVSKFTWRNSAIATLNGYEKIL